MYLNCFESSRISLLMFFGHIFHRSLHSWHTLGWTQGSTAALPPSFDTTAFTNGKVASLGIPRPKRGTDTRCEIEWCASRWRRRGISPLLGLLSDQDTPVYTSCSTRQTEVRENISCSRETPQYLWKTIFDNCEGIKDMLPGLVSTFTSQTSREKPSFYLIY